MTTIDSQSGRHSNHSACETNDYYVIVNDKEIRGPIPHADAVQLAHRIATGDGEALRAPLAIDEVISLLHTIAEQRLSGTHTIDVTAHSDSDFQASAYYTITDIDNMVTRESDSHFYRERIFFSTHPFCCDDNGGAHTFYHQVIKRSGTDDADCTCVWMESIDMTDYDDRPSVELVKSIDSGLTESAPEDPDPVTIEFTCNSPRERGSSSYDITVHKRNGTTYRTTKQFNDVLTSDEVEYRALIAACGIARDFGYTDVHFKTDSQFVVTQINKGEACSSPSVHSLHQQSKALLDGTFDTWTLRNH